MIRRGYIYLARLPDEGKHRPVIVLSPDRRNDLAHDVMVVPCSTVRRLGPWHVELRAGAGGLPKASVAKCEHVTTLPKDRLAEPALGGPLPRQTLLALRGSILRALDYEE